MIIIIILFVEHNLKPEDWYFKIAFKLKKVVRKTFPSDTEQNTNLFGLAGTLKLLFKLVQSLSLM